VADLSNNSKPISRITLSRNSPVALIVGCAGFLGSHLTEKLLDKGVQVVGVDDFSTGKKEFLKKALDSNKFHLINQPIENPLSLDLLRMDYAFFVADLPREGSALFKRQRLFHDGIKNFLSLVKEHSPKVVLCSRIELYDNHIPANLETLKQAEIHLAKFAKEHHLNARIVRLAPVYGPRMRFDDHDPVIRLIQASLLKELQDEHTSLDFSTRSLYIDDAVDLLVKTVFYGSTAQKIYDGALLEPIEVKEIKQILLDPLWYEEKGFKPNPIPKWPTPNLNKTSKELSWKPQVDVVKGLKETIAYFKENKEEVPSLKPVEFEREARKWDRDNQSISEPVDQKDEDAGTKDSGKPKEKEWNFDKSRGWKLRFRDKLPFFLCLALITYAIVFPVVTLAVGGFSIKQHLKNSSQLIQAGEFDKATEEISQAKGSLDQLEGLVGSVAILKRLGIFNSQLDRVDELLSTLNVGVEGVSHATIGTQALYQTTKIVSGENPADPKPLFNKAELELGTASIQIAQVRAKLEDESFLNGLPTIAKDRIVDFQGKLRFYSDLVEKARLAAVLLPKITAVDGKASYLVLLENNLELRGSGGFIGSYAKLDFEGGRLKNIKVDDIYNLDGSLKDHVEPPAEIKNDLGQKDFFLRDSNFEPDFPTAARQAEFFYNKEAGERVNGVISIDLSASGALLNAVGGLDLPDYGEHVDGSNLFERAITHAEVGFFPGSQAKKNYLTSLQTQLFNKIFFLSKQNWPGIIQAMSSSLGDKHIQLYLDDPSLFSYVTGQSWGGAIPRPAKEEVGKTDDFLAAIDTNLGANKANYYLERNYNLETSVGKEGQIFHHLIISYKNNSPSEVFPAGKYKNRFRIYLPLGSKLTKASFGESDITKSVTTYSDYGRTVYSMLVELNPREAKTLTLDYTPPKPLNFTAGDNGTSAYSLNVFKQAGTDKDSFKWNLTYPINLKVTSIDNQAVTSANQEVNINTDLKNDRSFSLNFSK
jgi:UDP-glucuronate decarboxylase